MGDVDIVIPWVNGEDKIWQETLFRYSPERKNKFDKERYRDWGLLKYWFRGIEKFAPWVRKIHFVTCGHIPEWLDISHNKLNIVYHEDYIPNEYLPVFSSHPIEIFFNRIDGLSEYFVYFNDDMYLIDKTNESDFFKNSLPCDVAAFNALTPGDIGHILLNNLSAIGKNFNKRDVVKRDIFKWFNFMNFDKSIRTMVLMMWPGFTGFYEHHLPQPYLKSVLDEVWDKELLTLSNTALSKFRTDKDVNMYLFRYWQLCLGKFNNIALKKHGKYFTVNDSSVDSISAHISGQKTKAITLNDEPNIDFNSIQVKLLSSFEHILPEKSAFELHG